MIGETIVSIEFFILSETKDPCLFADAGKMPRSFASLRMTNHLRNQKAKKYG